MQRFKEAIFNEDETPQALKLVLLKLCSLYGLSSLETHLTTLYQGEAITGEDYCPFLKRFFLEKSFLTKTITAWKQNNKPIKTRCYGCCQRQARENHDQGTQITISFHLHPIGRDVRILALIGWSTFDERRFHGNRILSMLDQFSF